MSSSPAQRQQLWQRPLFAVLLMITLVVPTSQAFLLRNNNGGGCCCAAALLETRGYGFLRSSLSSLGRRRFGISSSSSSTTALRMIMSVDSNDPFVVLGLDNPSVDKKEIKRAYKRMALKYHPDVVVGKDATAEQKAQANDRFAKINWAYEVLSGKGATAASAETYAGTSSSSSSSTGWTPPHRRRGAYASSSSGARGTTSSKTTSDRDYVSSSTDWRDYMPQSYNDDQDYDAGGDSFGAIFSDLLTGVAGAVAGGGGGILNDFVEFLEQVEGYGGDNNDDAELRLLLQTGSVQEIGEEMDDTELIVQQLSSKLKNVQDELITIQAAAKVASRYIEKLEVEERIAELQARQKVVEGYIQKARKRLLSLQTRYKQLIVDGNNDSWAGGRESTRSWKEPPSSSTYSSTSSSTRTTRPRHEKEEDAWKDDSFGSFGRGRGSSRRRRSRRDSSASETSSRTSRTASTASSGAGGSSSPSSSPSWSSESTRTTSQPRTPTSSSESRRLSQPQSNVPPHRRTSSFGREQDDKRRLRELKVDEEFDQLKKDLGL